MCNKATALSSLSYLQLGSYFFDSNQITLLYKLLPAFNKSVKKHLFIINHLMA